MPSLKQTWGHEKHPEIDIMSPKMSNLLDHVPLRKSAIYSFHLQPPIFNTPKNQRNCQGARHQDEGGVVALHLEIKSAMDPWKVSRPNDRLCLGAKASQDSMESSGLRKVELFFLGGGELFLLENPWNATLTVVFFSLFYIQKLSKFRKRWSRIIKGLLHLQSLIHLCTKMLWCLASPQLRWSHEAPSNQPFLEVHSISILDTLHLHITSNIQMIINVLHITPRKTNMKMESQPFKGV